MLEENKMKQIVHILGIACLGMLFLVSLVGCKGSCDEKLLELNDSYYEVTKWCSGNIWLHNGSGNYDISINDEAGLKLSFEDTNRLNFQGIKEGLYELQVTDKETKEKATATIKVLPQAIIISASRRDLNDDLFTPKAELFLMGDTENKCFILSPWLQGTTRPTTPTFEGSYEMIEDAGKITSILLYDKNKNKIRTYKIETSDEEVLDCLSKLVHRQPWEKDSPYFQDGRMTLTDGQNVLKATLYLAGSFLPEHLYN